MRNEVIKELVNRGFLRVTTLTLNAESAYTVYKVKREIRKINTELQEKIDEIYDESLGKELVNILQIPVSNRTEENKMLIVANEDKIRKSNEVVLALLNDDVKLDITPLSYKDWHALLVENPNFKIGEIEFELENILFA